VIAMTILYYGFKSILSVTQNIPKDQNLPFDDRVIFAVLMLFYWLIVFIFTLILLDARLMTKKLSIAIYSITVVIGGIILGGIPNPVVPIGEILTSIGIGANLWYLLQAVLLFSTLILTSLLVGRVFCGFACPIGALQELLSKFKFKSNLEGQVEIKFRLDVSSRKSTKIRWIFTSVIIVVAIVWSVQILPIINPLSGFSFLKDISFIIPFMLLIIFSIISIFIYRPWCRFFCPFGAGSAYIAGFAKNKLDRTDDCADCGNCEIICPTHVASRENKKGECYYCGRCVEVCPNDAIIFSLEN
jgi:polyferredoxin